MKYLKAALASAMIGSMTSAFAGAGVVNTTVTSLQDNVTYSKPATTKPVAPALTTYVGYTVTVANAGGNTINNIRFTGTTSVTDPAELAVFSSAEGGSCVTTNAAKTAIECSIGQLTTGRGTTFTVFFLAPEDKQPIGVKSVVKFQGSTFYAEGTGGVPNSVPQNSIREWICSPSPLPEGEPPTVCEVELGTFNPERIKSAVPKAGGTFFTGNGGVTTQADRFSTQVVIPSSAAFTTAVIEEAALSGVCTFLFICDETKLTIPPPAGASQFTPYLTIVLRADASNIRPGTKINSVLLEYVPDAQNSTPLPIDECATGPIPPPNKPCIAKRTYYKNKSVPGWTLDLDGDFEWTLVSFNNGRIAIRK